MHFFRYTLLVCLFFINFTFGTLWEALYDNLIGKYERPITILYISDSPELILPVRSDDVVVLWCWEKVIEQSLYRKHATNYVLLTAEISQNNLLDLSKCEHFDLAIIDVYLDYLFLINDLHLADHTVFLSIQQFGIPQIGISDNKKIYLISKPKTVLPKNWWQSCNSIHQNYPIVSTFEEKFFIKPAEFTHDGISKNYYWKPGINLYTFCNLNGVYPSKEYIREKVLEIFNPLTHKDFGIANIIIQGLRLKAIDYADTIYVENPYHRLVFVLEQQLKVTYTGG